MTAARRRPASPFPSPGVTTRDITLCHEPLRLDTRYPLFSPILLSSLPPLTPSSLPLVLPHPHRLHPLPCAPPLTPAAPRTDPQPLAPPPLPPAPQHSSPPPALLTAPNSPPVPLSQPPSTTPTTLRPIAALRSTTQRESARYHTAALKVCAKHTPPAPHHTQTTSPLHAALRELIPRDIRKEITTTHTTPALEQSPPLIPRSRPAANSPLTCSMTRAAPMPSCARRGRSSPWRRRPRVRP